MSPPNLEVGRYGAFIWPAYGVSVFVLGGLLVDSLVRARRWRRAAERRDGRAPEASRGS